jgi:hypothetical protein
MNLIVILSGAAGAVEGSCRVAAWKDSSLALSMTKSAMNIHDPRRLVREPLHCNAMKSLILIIPNSYTGTGVARRSGMTCDCSPRTLCGNARNQAVAPPKKNVEVVSDLRWRSQPGADHLHKNTGRMPARKARQRDVGIGGNGRNWVLVISNWFIATPWSP